jgi:hypothetical protein
MAKKRQEAMPVRVSPDAYDCLKRLTSKAAREGWRSVGFPERDDPPTLSAVLGAALTALEQAHPTS